MDYFFYIYDGNSSIFTSAVKDFLPTSKNNYYFDVSKLSSEFLTSHLELQSNY